MGLKLVATVGFRVVVFEINRDVVAVLEIIATTE